MTNQKICDKCKGIIPKGKDYIKLVLIKHEGKRQLYGGQGHMCLKCFEEFAK